MLNRWKRRGELNHSEPSEAPTSTGWFQDDDALIIELQRERSSRASLPEIPGYADLRELSRGGQGVVYLAKQNSTGQQVAIKVLLEGSFATDHARLRFEREIDLVARLRHPGIVRIHDSGITADGRSYFVMEFIEGLSLDEHLKSDLIPKSHHGIERIVELFIALAGAINYAHQRGVIHRDLKPSNVRVDERGEPHILDFGLATIVEEAKESSIWHTTTTSAAGFMGSLPWASPEQAKGLPGAVDVRSDVYALGVMLYAAVSGAMPYDISGSMREVLTNIIDTPPRRLSTIVSFVTRDLETIIHKCLAKEPERRYQTAGELADDLRHFLAGEPVSARPDTISYRTVTFVRRHRVPVIAASLICLALIIGTTASLWQALIAKENEQVATRRFEEARRFVRSLIFDSDDAIRAMPGQTQVRELMVRQALPYLDALAEEAQDNPALQLELAQAYVKIGDIQGRPNAPNLGDAEGARVSYAKADLIAKRLLDRRDPVVRGAQWVHAEVLAAKGEIEAWDGNVSLGMRLLEESRDAFGTIARANDAAPSDRLAYLHAMIRVADYTGHASFPNVGRAEDALLMYSDVERTLEQRDYLDRNSVEVLRLRGMIDERIGGVCITLGRLDDALKRFEESLTIRAALASANPENLDVHRDHGVSLTKVGETQRLLGRLDDSIATFELGVPILEDLMQRDPANVREVRSAAVASEQLADTLQWSGHVERAVERMRYAVSLYDRIVQRDPNRARAVHMASVGRVKLADMLGHPAFPNLGQVDESIDLYTSARLSFESLLSADPTNPGARRYVGLVHERLGTMSLVRDDTEGAISHFERSRTIREELASQLSTEFDVERDVGVILGQLAEAHHLAGDFDVAVEEYDRAIQTYDALQKKYPDVVQLEFDAATALEALAGIYADWADDPQLNNARRDELADDEIKTLEKARVRWSDLVTRGLNIPPSLQGRLERIGERLTELGADIGTNGSSLFPRGGGQSE